MHLPDGFIDGPTALATGAVAIGATGFAIRRARRELGERTVPALGVTAAFIFAAQMVNFPVAGGTSGHLLGGVLAAVLLGPWPAVIVMSVVVFLQAIGMADGGISALGANVMNMAVVGSLGGWVAFRALRGLFGRSHGAFVAAAAGAAWLSVVLSAAAAAAELAASGTLPADVALPAMVGVHMAIGVGEAFITVGVLGAVLASRPDLVHGYVGTGGRSAAGSPRGPGGAPGGPEGSDAGAAPRLRLGGFLAAALALSLAVAVLLSPLASSDPDGLERVAEDQGFAGAAEEPAISLSPLPGYEFPGLEGGAAVAAAGFAGTVAVFALVLALGRWAGRRGRGASGGERESPDGHGHGGGHGAVGHRHSGHEHARRET